MKLSHIQEAMQSHHLASLTAAYKLCIALHIAFVIDETFPLGHECLQPPAGLLQIKGARRERNKSVPFSAGPFPRAIAHRRTCSLISRALNVSTDQLLSDAPAAKHLVKAALSPRLERRLKQIEQLNPKSKPQLPNVIDTFIENEALKQRGSR